jgi:hypothetical protein
MGFFIFMLLAILLSRIDWKSIKPWGKYILNEMENRIPKSKIDPRISQRVDVDSCLNV